jgi:4-hydroxy-2-oxoheptanedioate aldolase
MGPFVSHSRWGVSMAEYASTTVNDTVCMLLIETVDALENIEEICQVEGVVCMIVASFDLSTELDVSGQFDHPKFLDAVARIEAATFKAGMPLGAVGSSKEQTEAAIAKGYRLLGAFDVIWLKNAIQQSIEWTKGAP